MISINEIHDKTSRHDHKYPVPYFRYCARTLGTVRHMRRHGFVDLIDIRKPTQNSDGKKLLFIIQSPASHGTDLSLMAKATAPQIAAAATNAPAIEGYPVNWVAAVPSIVAIPAHEEGSANLASSQFITHHQNVFVSESHQVCRTF